MEDRQEYTNQEWRGRMAYKYHFIYRGTVVHRNITSDLTRREKEHRVRWPQGHIQQVGKEVAWSEGQEWLRTGGLA